MQALHDKETLFDIAYKGDIETIKLKFKESKKIITDKDENERLLIHWAALGGHREIVEFLAENGSPVDTKDDFGATPLILASSAGKSTVVHLLLSLGAAVNEQNDGGHTSLQYAASKGWVEIVEMLLKSQADPYIRDKHGATPLHRAASHGNQKILKLLLSGEKKDVNIVDTYGNTPLHLSCDEDRVDTAVLLVQEGAKLDIKNKEEKTPLELASPALVRQLKSLAGL